MIKIRLFIALLLFVLQIGFSQNEKPINGIVLCNNFPVQGVEVINAVSKKMTLTDSQGHFSIAVKAKDLLVFVSKTHLLKKATVEQKTIDKNDFTISLSLKAEELQEVVITKIPTIQLNKDRIHEEGQISRSAVEKAALAPRVIGVNDGTIENGMNLMKVGSLLLSLFKKEKKPAKKSVPKMEFKAFATANYPPDFFSNHLKLKPEEIPLFLEFCDADPKSRIIAENPNSLSLMEFLITKNIEFKKL
jgi:hypothetical protein